MVLALIGCQVTTESEIGREKEKIAEKKKEVIHYSHYYLWIKSLNSTELSAEIERQLQKKHTGQQENSLELIMLYSLPSSPNHNPYTAKAQLNSLQLKPESNVSYSTADLAFIVMLKDQLNQQLLQFEELANYKGAYKKAQKMIATEQLKISQLNQQLIQLKLIEKNISEREQ